MTIETDNRAMTPEEYDAVAAEAAGEGFGAVADVIKELRTLEEPKTPTPVTNMAGELATGAATTAQTPPQKAA